MGEFLTQRPGFLVNINAQFRVNGFQFKTPKNTLNCFRHSSRPPSSVRLAVVHFRDHRDRHSNVVANDHCLSVNDRTALVDC